MQHAMNTPPAAGPTETPTAPQSAHRVDILGVSVDPISIDELLSLFSYWIDGDHRSCHQVCTVNPEFVMDARTDPAFAAVLRQADCCVADGTGIVLAAAMQGFISAGSCHRLRRYLSNL